MKKLLLLGTGLVAPAVLAQTPPPPEPAAATAQNAGDFGDIVVTAQRRPERLLEVPIAVTALTGSQIASAGLTDTSNLQQVTPGLNWNRNGGIQQPTIRGVGTRGATPGDESNVPTYLDGVYVGANNSGTFELSNVERIEVLKGPQGTLFGRNATGGAISVTTLHPSLDDVKLKASATYGNLEAFRAEGYVSGPLANRVAASVLAYAERDHGYTRDLVTGQRFAERRLFGIQGKLLVEPTDRLRLTLWALHNYADDASSNANAPIARNTVARQPSATIPGAGPNVLLPSDERDVALSFEPVNKFKNTIAAADVAYDLDGVSLVSITSVQRNRVDAMTDSDASPALVQSTAPIQTARTVTQEFRILSNDDSRVQWIVGAFGYWNVSKYDPLNIFTSTARTQTFTRQSSDAYAAFGEVRWEFLPNLFATGGLRYSYEKREYDAQSFSGARTAAVLTPGAPLSAKKSFDAVTPRLSLRYEANPHTNFYITYSEGFKSGVFNASSAAASAGIPVDPERLKAVEAGVKARLTRWLRFDASAFHYDYKDLQVAARDASSGLSTLQNAGSARMKGAEASLSAAPIDGLVLNAGLAYLDAEYRSFPNAQITVPRVGGGNTQIFADVSGFTLPRAPEWTGNVSAEYSYPIGNDELIASANVYHNSGYIHDPSGRLREPAFTVLNAQLAWKWSNGAKVALWGRNLTDEVYSINVITSATADYIAYARPRTYGVTLSFER